MEAGEGAFCVALDSQLLEIRLLLLRIDQEDSCRKRFNSFGEVAHRLEALTESKLADKRVSLQLIIPF